ncbi:hypothetical protein CURTO8I2_120040 [Curtobacterium sp. 8I-2]|nr:hypothetical protein CURTO8I2_120040 [Curtobacterium sp. 8I-2]
MGALRARPRAELQPLLASARGHARGVRVRLHDHGSAHPSGATGPPAAPPGAGGARLRLDDRDARRHHRPVRGRRPGTRYLSGLPSATRATPGARHGSAPSSVYGGRDRCPLRWRIRTARYDW